MRRIDDYSSEMDPLAISDSDVERVLRGQTPAGPGLSRLIAVIDELRAMGSRPIGHEVHPRLVAMAAAAALEARPPSSEPAPATQRPAAAPRWRLLPRFATSMAALAVVMGMTGVAVASDASVPGEPLHRIDLFLENLGIGDGGPEERIAEAQDLTSNGMPAEALNHLSVTISDHDESGAREALQTAAAKLKEDNPGSDRAEEARAKVAEMLRWMATNDPKGEGFGQGVAERAQSLSGNSGSGPAAEEPGPPADPGSRGQGQGAGSSAGKGNGRPAGKGR